MQMAEVSSWITLGEGAQFTHTRNPKIALLRSFVGNSLDSSSPGLVASAVPEATVGIIHFTAPVSGFLTLVDPHPHHVDKENLG